MVRQPRYQASAQANYVVPIGDSTLTFTLSPSYNSRVYFDFANQLSQRPCVPARWIDRAGSAQRPEGDDLREEPDGPGLLSGARILHLDDYCELRRSDHLRDQALLCVQVTGRARKPDDVLWQSRLGDEFFVGHRGSAGLRVVRARSGGHSFRAAAARARPGARPHRWSERAADLARHRTDHRKMTRSPRHHVR